MLWVTNNRRSSSVFEQDRKCVGPSTESWLDPPVLLHQSTAPGADDGINPAQTTRLGNWVLLRRERRIDTGKETTSVRSDMWP